mgnify:CR=1 FL=1
MSDKAPPSVLSDRSSAMSAPEAKTESGALRGESEVIRGMLEMLFERNPDPVCYTDPKGNIFINAAAQAMGGTGPFAPDDSGVGTWSEKYGCFLPDGKTVHPTETLPLARALRGEVVRDYEMIIKNPHHPEGIWILASAMPLPNGYAMTVCRDITERKRLECELEERNSELARQVRENNSLIERLRLAMDELSTPVLELWDDILALPVVGVVDTVRSARMMEKVLAEAVSRRCRSVIIDLTGVDVIDTGTADRFLRIASSIELLGAECVISGVQPLVAQTLTDLGVGFHGLVTKRNLKRALDYCIGRQPQAPHRGPAA